MTQTNEVEKLRSLLKRLVDLPESQRQLSYLRKGIGTSTALAVWLEAEAMLAKPPIKVSPDFDLEALSHDLVLETERAIKQRDEFLRTGKSTAAHGGSHDTCFPAILRKHFDYKYKIGDKVILDDGRKGTITYINHNRAKSYVVQLSEDFGGTFGGWELTLDTGHGKPE